MTALRICYVIDSYLRMWYGGYSTILLEKYPVRRLFSGHRDNRSRNRSG